MKKTIYKLWSKFLTMFGNIKIFKWPMFFIYDPSEYEITGEKQLEILNIIKPGDIILRGYNNYLDGFFIPDPLKYSHGGIYIGKNIIIHAISEGVSEINVLDFTKCDRIAIFRPKKYKNNAIKKAKEFLKNKIPYDFGFSKNVSSLYCFELCGLSYDKLNIPRVNVKKLFGLIKKNDVFLAESFFKSSDMKCIFQYNPKFNLKISKQEIIK